MVKEEPFELVYEKLLTDFASFMLKHMNRLIDVSPVEHIEILDLIRQSGQFLIAENYAELLLDWRYDYYLKDERFNYECQLIKLRDTRNHYPVLREQRFNFAFA